MSRHPSIHRYLAAAINAGCRAKTDREIARFLLSRPHLLKGRRVLKYRDIIRGYDGRHAKVAGYRAERAKRLEHPEAKRANGDKAFRQKYLRKLARLESPFFAIKTIRK